MDNINNDDTFGLLTVEQTALLFPVGTVVRFNGYEDHIGYETGTFEPCQLLEVVGHSDSCGDDGLLVRRHGAGAGARVGLVFATEVARIEQVAP